MGKVYDNWGRLFGAVSKREELSRMALCPSLTSSSSAADANSTKSGDTGTSLSSGNHGAPSTTSDLKHYSFADLKQATRNFRTDMVLGEGASGTVYKGWVDENSLTPSKLGTAITMVVAIKRLKPEYAQGWQSELLALRKLSHPNLVKLFGYCVEDKEVLLVYEYMQKGSLENHLFRRNSSLAPLPWSIRLKVALGAARGLSFLHTSEKQMIYRAFKPSKIFLDGSYNAKLTNSGLAILGPPEGESDVKTEVMGTHVYAAPEYLATGCSLYVKSDVYGFGVVLLEMLTGRRALDMSHPTGQTNLVDWMKPLLRSKRKLKTIMDARMEGQYTSKAALEVAQLVLRWLNVEQSTRPSMEEVVKILQQISAMEKPRDSKTNWFMHVGIFSK